MTFFKPVLIIALLFIISAVGLGAFGSHGLSHLLTESQLNTFDTAVRYQMYHGIALLTLSVSGHVFHIKSWLIGQWILVAGTVMFSASLYLYLATQQTFFVFVTPLGGSGLILGWLWLIYGAFKGNSASKGSGK